jgi:hypothetical protein
LDVGSWEWLVVGSWDLGVDRVNAKATPTRINTAPIAVHSVGRSSRNTNPNASAIAGVNTLMKLRLVTLHVFSNEK